MGRPRLGAASVVVSISDAQGFKVVHGITGETLFQVAPEFVVSSAWDQLWSALNHIQMSGYLQYMGKNPNATVDQYKAENEKRNEQNNQPKAVPAT